MLISSTLGTAILGAMVFGRIQASLGFTTAGWMLFAVLGLIALAPILLESNHPRALLKDYGLSMQALYEQLIPLATATSLCGYGLAAIVADRIGHRRAIALGSVGMGLVWLCFGFAGLKSPDGDATAPLLLLAGLEGLFTGIFFPGLLAWLMDRSAPQFAASHFVMFTALVNLSSYVLGAKLGPIAVEHLEYAGTWVACGAFQVAFALVLLAKFTSRPGDHAAA